MKTNVISRIAKTFLIAAFMITAFAASVAAKPVDVNKIVMHHFQKQFSGASDVTWKRTSDFTSASFISNGSKTSVFYNSENSFVGISKDISLEDLPKAAQKAIDEHYSTFKVMSVIEFTDASGTFNYYIQLKNERKGMILRSDELGYLSDFQN